MKAKPLWIAAALGWLVAGLPAHAADIVHVSGWFPEPVEPTLNGIVRYDDPQQTVRTWANPMSPNLDFERRLRLRRNAEDSNGILEAAGVTGFNPELEASRDRLRDLLTNQVAQAGGRNLERAVSVRTTLQRVAGELPFLCVASVLKDRPLHRFSPKPIPDEETHERLVAELRQIDGTTEEFRALLSDPEPRVRTLAAVVLFQREEPEVLPDLARLAVDSAQTIDSLDEFPRGANVGASRQRHAQTVGNVCRAMVIFYMTRAGFHYGLEGPLDLGPVSRPSAPPHQAFRQYWEARKNRAFGASWFAVQLDRASQGTTLRPDHVGRIREVRKRIDLLPAEDRAWTLLWLGSSLVDEAAILVTEAELVNGCKELGPDALLKLLHYEIPSTDPDVQPMKNNNYRYGRVCLFVLGHSRQLLRPTDAEAVLECERWQYKYQERGEVDPLLSAQWVLAAVGLQPTNAVAQLREAYARFSDKYQQMEKLDLSVTLWRFGGAEQIPFIADWFYSFDPVLERGSSRHSQASFVDRLGAEKERDVRPLVGALIRDARFQRLGWQTLSSLASLVSTWTIPALISPEEIQGLKHPEGASHYDAVRSDAAKRFPAETHELEATLAGWRSRMRESVPMWLRERQP